MSAEENASQKVGNHIVSLRKTAGLLAAFGLMVGLIGGGIGAVFTDQVTADEHISVGTFECLIVEPSDGDIAVGGKSVSYTADTIMSSAPGSAPFSFTVAVTGTIPAVLQVSTSPVSAPFSIIGAPIADQVVASGGTYTYNTGVQWTELSSSNEGTSGTVTWTIDCVENVPTAVFDNTSVVLPPNLPSQPFQAQQTFEWGTQIQLAGTERDLTQAVVTMSTWAPRSAWPAWPTAAGWTHPITLNLYNENLGDPNLPGTLIDSVTQTFTIPWRPDADPTCPDTGYGAGFAWRAADTNCYNGFAFNITFDLSGEAIVAPDVLVVGIAYDTQSWGATPIGSDGPYNSLNVATFPGVANPLGNQPSIGTFPDPTIVFWDTVTASNYADGGAGGVGIFRLDTGWGGYEPAIKFLATN